MMEKDKLKMTLAKRYPRIYNQLKCIGHSAMQAHTILLDASRGQSFAILWIRTCTRHFRDTLSSQPSEAILP